MLKTVLTTAALGLAVVSTPVLAGSDGAPKVKVAISDLNLGTVEGQERLDRRIDYAARQVCKVDDIRTGTRLKSADRKKCYAKALKSVETQVAAQIQQQQRGG